MATPYVDAGTRLVVDKFGEVPSVLDFGVSTSTDFTTAIQAAIDSVEEAGGGALFFPRVASGTYAFGEISVPSNITLRGETGVKLARNADATSGRGWINIEGTNVHFQNLEFDGAVTTAATALYGTGTSSVLFNNDPMDTKLTSNSTIWVHPGSDDFSMDQCSIEHTGGYAVLIDVMTGDTKNVDITNCLFRNNRPTFFGTSTASMIYGGWNSGLFAKSDATGTNTFALTGWLVDNCTFERCSGNQVWSHCYGFDKLHHDFTWTNNKFRYIGLDGIQPGGVVNVTAANNTFEYMGFVTETDSDTPVARVVGAAYSVAMDASGYVDAYTLTNNTVYEVLGGAIDLDGCRNFSVTNNSCFTSQSIGKGIQPGNTSANGGSQNGVISGNYLEGMTNGAIVLSEGVGILVEKNRIKHPTAAATVPIVIYSPNATPTNNIIRNNHIDYSGANFCIIEDEAAGTPWDSSNVNQVYGNTCLGAALGEFKKAAGSSSITGQYFPSNYGTLSLKSDYLLQSEGEDDSAAFKFYHVTTAAATQQMDLLRRRASGVNDPLLRIGTATGEGGVFTGGRSGIGFGDAMGASKQLTYGFTALRGITAAGHTYVDGEANGLDTDWALWRYDETGPTIQFSTATATSGDREWVNFSAGAGTPGGTVGDVQYHGTGSVLAGDNGFTYNNVTRQVLIAASTDTLAALTVSTGYVDSQIGFVTTNTAVDSIQAPVGGVQARYLIANTSYTQLGTSAAAAGLSASGYGRIYFDSTANRFKVSEHGGAYVNLTGGSPGGADTYVQFNDAGAFGGNAGLVYNKTSQTVTLANGTGNATLNIQGVGFASLDMISNDGAVFIAGRSATSSGAKVAGPIMEIVSSGFNGSGYNSGAKINFLAGSTFSGSNAESYITFTTVPSASLTQSERMRITSGGLLYINRTSDDSSGAQVQLTGYMSATTGYYTASSASDAFNAPSGGGKAVVWISERNDADSGIVVQRTSSVARAWGLGVDASGYLQVRDRTGSANRISIDTSGNVTMTISAIAPIFNATATGSSYVFQGNGGTFVVDGNGNISGAGQVNMTGAYKRGGTTVIDTSNSFVGNGVAVGSAGIGGGAFALWSGSGYTTPIGTIGTPTTFTTVDGKTVYVAGSIIVAVV